MPTDGTTPGAHAERPRDIPMAGWRAILGRAWREAGRDHVSLIAAGVAFYGLLALFPAITALVAIAGLLLEPSQVTSQIEAASALLPENAAEIVIGQAAEVAGSQSGGLGLAAALGIALALYSASKGVASMIEGLNVAYDETDERGFVHRTLLNLGLTLGLILGVSIGLGALVVLPGVLSVLELGRTTEILISAARWALLLAMVVLGIAVLYRFGPDRSAARWRWLTPGAVLACLVWLLASVGFSVYADNFASYNESFGTLAGAIVLLTWMWISAYILLLGAEVNAEAELQTRVDTTAGPPMPMGARGAVKADRPPPDPS